MNRVTALERVWEEYPSHHTRHANSLRARKCLLIGINYFGQRGQLQGCTRDVRNMRAYLVEHAGYRREDMVVLTDDQQALVSQPTRQNILQAMHWLVNGAMPNDSLFFYHSGHGDHAADLDSDEPDRVSAPIYPIDFRQHGHITDEEIYRAMIQPLPAGVRLVIILDSYHASVV